METTTDAAREADRIGRRRFLRDLGVAGAAAGAGLATGAVAAPFGAHAAPAGTSVFVPLAQQTRFADTRNPGPYPFESLIPGRRIRVQIAGRAAIPANATAVVVTLTAVNKDQYNFVTIHPAGQLVPEASNLNMATFDEVAANLATVQLGANGAVEIDSYRNCEMIVDVAGSYVPATGPVRAGRFVGLPVARRVLDTRATSAVPPNGSVDVDLTSVVPADASTVIVNLTTTGTFGWGFLTCYGLDTTVVPETSNLNVNGPGEERAAQAVVKITTAGGRRGFRVWSFGGGHVIVDVTGWYSGPTSAQSNEGLFVPTAPNRILDTRKPGTIGKLWKDWVVEAGVPGEAATGAQAIVANVTAVECREPGFFTVLAAGSVLQEVSNLNADTKGETIPNHVISRISTRGIGVYAQWGAHVLIDMSGWFTGTPQIPAVTYVNPPPPPIAPPWRLEVPRIGLSSWIFAGSNSLPIVDAGHSWHWTGTGYLGQDAHVGVFAHRTTAGGPYRFMHYIQPGDEMNIFTTDGRVYRYRMVRRDITGSRAADILNATRRHPGTTVSMIACTKTDGTPTSTAYRLIVTGQLEGWEEA